MATTKELLETAIRKVASNAIGRDSSNQGTVAIAVNSTSTDWQSYTPPADGFIFLHMEGGGNPAVLHMKDYTNNPAIENLTAYPEARNIKTMRVWKGKTALFKAATTHTSLTAQFFKSIGGGLRLLAETLWRSGGELWLRLRVYLEEQSTQPLREFIRQQNTSLTFLSQLRHTKRIFGDKKQSGYRQKTGGLVCTLITFVASSFRQQLKQSGSALLRKKRLIRSSSRKAFEQFSAHSLVQGLQEPLLRSSSLKIESWAVKGGVL